LLGRKHRQFSMALVLVLFIMGLALWPGWLIWAILLIILGIDHPPILYEHIALDGKRKFIGILCFIIFILTITPVPFSINMQ
ncbi:MAG: site-2 protease family protein, partial [Nitrospirota bacterium]